MNESVWASDTYRDLAEQLLRMSRRKSLGVANARLEASAFAILWILADGRPRTLRELTDELGLDQSTVNRQVNAAIKHGYLERFEVDGRISKLIRPTDAGREAFEADGLARARRLERVFESMHQGTPEQLLAELRSYNDAFDHVLSEEHLRRTS